MLAPGWRALHHISFGVYEESGERKAKCWDVPDAGLRRADDGNALADAETRSGTFSASASEESRSKDSSKRSDWRRSGNGAGRDAADSTGPRRDDVRRILAARACGNGALRDKRFRGACECGDCGGGLRQSE